jgi:pectin methylesterase-like acyl-CoA thioesterase
MNKNAALLFIFIIIAASYTISFLPAKATAKTIVVPDDYATIEDAVTNAVQGDTVFVKKGTYHETLKIEKSISLIGENRDSTIIVGTLKGGVKVPLTIRQNNVSVAGFTLRDGYAGIQLNCNFCKISGNR